MTLPVARIRASKTVIADAREISSSQWGELVVNTDRRRILEELLTTLDAIDDSDTPFEVAHFEVAAGPYESTRVKIDLEYDDRVLDRIASEPARSDDLDDDVEPTDDVDEREFPALSPVLTYVRTKPRGVAFNDVEIHNALDYDHEEIADAIEYALRLGYLYRPTEDTVKAVHL